MNGLFVSLLKKEWLDAIRDKRAFTAAMLIAFIGPVMLWATITLTVDRIEQAELINITVEGHEQFPSLMEALKAQGIHTDHAEAKDSGIKVTIDEEFAEKINNAETADIIIVADYAEHSTQRRVGRIKDVLRGFSGELAGMRLIARGVAPSVINPIKIVEQDTSSAQSKAGLFLGMISSFVLMSVFIASTNVAIDCSAGERERNALEFLLAQPVKTFTLVIAKTLNTSFFGLVGAGLTLLMMAVVLQFAPLHKLGLDFVFNAQMAISIWLVMVPLAAFAAAMQLITSFKSKTFKEAQSYLNMTIMVPMLIPMIITMSNIEHPALAWLPLTGQNEYITNLVKGADVDLLALLVSSLGSFGLAAAFVMVITRGLKTEKMILGL